MISISLIPIKKSRNQSPDMKGILNIDDKSIPVIAYLNDEQSSLSIAESKYPLKPNEIKNIECLIELETTKKNPGSKYPDYKGQIREHDKTIDVVAWTKRNNDSLFPMLIRKNKK